MNYTYEGFNMKWLILLFSAVIAIGSCFRFIPGKGGRHKFWEFAKSHPEVAYYFFKGEDCFMVFDYTPQNGNQPDLPSGEWEGPFKLPVPSRRCTLTIYGRSPYYHNAMQNFIERFRV